jgi:hypothetical protein
MLLFWQSVLPDVVRVAAGLGIWSSIFQTINVAWPQGSKGRKGSLAGLLATKNYLNNFK